jgi:predicted nucleotidyltransferase
VLDLKQVDLPSVAEALEDHSDMNEWWLDPTTGQVEPWAADPGFAGEAGEDHPAERDWVRLEAISSRESYGDMEDFTARVRDLKAHDLLERAIAGRGAFRRFKDTLFDFPELREAWFRFHDVRMERRALQWLADSGLLDQTAAAQAMQERPDPDLPELSGAFDAEEIALAVAAELRHLYGGRLRTVLLFGSWARGDAHPDSDIDLLVVLDRVDSVWDELRKMDEILWRHSFENDTIITVLPVGKRELEDGARPVVVRARAEGVAIA